SDESETTQNHQSKFKDISQVSWAHEALYYLEDKGVIAGVEEDKFDPMASVTREQFIKMLLCAFNLNDSSAAVDFNDVDGNAWYYPYVASAVKAGIVTGRDDNSFGVGERITRQDMAVLVNRCIQKTGYRPAGSDLTFDDVNSIADYAKEAVGFMKYAKVINGMGDGNFAPAQTATRAQSAVIIYNAMKITGYVEEA
ncbi:MAG: S-layer homology domain-containing protein, partial [Clostridia bacterium]|nr:S-layer homology domain-containing protein [Clostridia bacterium]